MKKKYSFDVDLETGEIDNIREFINYPNEFFSSLPDLEYDRDVPKDFGKEK